MSSLGHVLFVWTALSLLGGSAVTPPAWLSQAVADRIIEMAELLAHPEQYDKQIVSVVGEVANLETFVTRNGQSGYAFLLKASGGTVKVIGMGTVPAQNGESVLVQGLFNRLRQAGRSAVLNEIKAELVQPLNRFIPELVG